MSKMIVGRNPDGSYRYSAGAGSDRTFDELADAVESEADQGVMNAKIERAKAEYEKRRELFLHYSPDPGLAERIAVSTMRTSGYARFRPTPLGCGVSLAIIGIGAVFGPIGFFVAVGLLIFAGLSMESNRNARRNRARRQLESTDCRKCGYSLVGIPSVVPIERAGVDFGPKACPECGERWPRVPPLQGP